MGIIDDLAVIHYPISQLAFVDLDGREKSSFSYQQFRRLFDNWHFNFMRGELEKVLWSHLPEETSTKFETTVKWKWLQYEDDQVSVETTDGKTDK